MIKNVLPSILYALEAYITFAENFVTIAVTVSVFDYFTHAANYMVNAVAAPIGRV